jgi:hypothetical protein
VDAQLFDDDDNDPSSTLFPSLPKWVIANLIDVVDFLASPSRCNFKLPPSRAFISVGPSPLDKYWFSPSKTI